MTSYTINKSKFGDFDEFILKNKETLESVKIVSGFGCNVRELILKQDIHLHQVISGHLIPSKLKKKYSMCAMMTPFVGRVPDGVYKFKDKKYNLEINKSSENVAIHGLIYDKKFELVDDEITTDFASITFEFNISEDMFQGYPFSLSIRKKFILSESGLEIVTYAKNTGVGALPFSDGWHPHFSLGKTINDSVLELEAKSMFNLNSRKVVSGSKKRLPKMSKYNPGNGVIGNRVFDNCYTDVVRKENLNGLSEAVLHFDSMKLILWFDEKYNFIQIYTPEDRKTIAIEPMTSVSNSFNNKIGLIILKPTDSFEGHYGVSLRGQ